MCERKRGQKRETVHMLWRVAVCKSPAAQKDTCTNFNLRAARSMGWKKPSEFSSVCVPSSQLPFNMSKDPPWIFVLSQAERHVKKTMNKQWVVLCLPYKYKLESDWRDDSMTGVNTERKMFKKTCQKYFSIFVLNIENLPSKAEIVIAHCIAVLTLSPDNEHKCRPTWTSCRTIRKYNNRSWLLSALVF